MPGLDHIAEDAIIRADTATKCEAFQGGAQQLRPSGDIMESEGFQNSICEHFEYMNV